MSQLIKGVSEMTVVRCSRTSCVYNVMEADGYMGECKRDAIEIEGCIKPLSPAMIAEIRKMMYESGKYIFTDEEKERLNGIEYTTD